MRFGLSDLDELPSLKEFEQLARQALGSDEGIAPIEPEDLAEGIAEDVAPTEGTAEVQAAGSEAPMSDATGSSETAATETESEADSKTRAAENGS